MPGSVPAPGAGDPPARRPDAVRAAAAVVVVQGAALALLALGYAVALLVGRPHNRGLALTGAALGVLAGVAVVLAGRGLWRRRRAAYSPVVLAEVLALPVGIGLAQAGLWPSAVVVLAPAVGVLAVLLATRAGRRLAAG